jgi:hypothetical protein
MSRFLFNGMDHVLEIRVRKFGWMSTIPFIIYYFNCSNVKIKTVFILTNLFILFNSIRIDSKTVNLFLNQFILLNFYYLHLESDDLLITLFTIWIFISYYFLRKSGIFDKFREIFRRMSIIINSDEFKNAVNETYKRFS